MDKFIVITSLVTALLLVIAGGAIVYSSSPGGVAYSPEDAQKIAKDFVASESTFKYDGMADTLAVKSCTAKTVDTYEVIAEFTSRSAGYGDRTGMMTAQMLTPHEAVIIVEKGKVTSAGMDGQWDMIAQKAIDVVAPMPRLDGNNVIPTIPDGPGDKPQL